MRYIRSFRQKTEMVMKNFLKSTFLAAVLLAPSAAIASDCSCDAGCKCEKCDCADCKCEGNCGPDCGCKKK